MTNEMPHIIFQYQMHFNKPMMNYSMQHTMPQHQVWGMQVRLSAT